MLLFDVLWRSIELLKKNMSFSIELMSVQVCVCTVSYDELFRCLFWPNSFPFRMFMNFCAMLVLLKVIERVCDLIEFIIYHGLKSKKEKGQKELN